MYTAKMDQKIQSDVHNNVILFNKQILMHKFIVLPFFSSSHFYNSPLFWKVNFFFISWLCLYIYIYIYIYIFYAYWAKVLGLYYALNLPARIIRQVYCTWQILNLIILNMTYIKKSLLLRMYMYFYSIY